MTGHGHLWTLLDGTPAHAPVGELTVNDSGQIACHLCGDWFNHLGAHLRRHNWTATEYRKVVGLELHVPLCNRVLSQRIATRQTQQWRENPAIRDAFATGHALARSGELTKLARAAIDDRYERGEIPDSVRRNQRDTLAQGRATSLRRQETRLAALMSAAGFTDLADYLSTGYLAGDSLQTLSTRTGLTHARIRTEIQHGGATVRATGHNLLAHKHQRARDIDLAVARAVGAGDIYQWLHQQRADGRTLTALAARTGRSTAWVASRLSGRGTTTRPRRAVTTRAPAARRPHSAHTEPGDGCAVRPARSDEAGPLLNIGRESCGYLAPLDTEDNYSVVLVATTDGQVSGFARILRSTTLPDTNPTGPPQIQHAQLDIVFVFEQWRGRGIGRQLIDHVRRAATALGDSELRIVSQPWAEGFFARVGAHRVGACAPDRDILWYRPIFEIKLNRTTPNPADST